ncbi:unnamed protein product, partial [Thlaspi arvense]
MTWQNHKRPKVICGQKFQLFRPVIDERARKIQSDCAKMPVMEKLRMFVAQEPVVAASCLIGGVGLFLPAVVRPILDSLEASKQVKAPPLTDV